MLVGILAKKRHGKDTTADYLVENKGFTKTALADPLKDICRILFDFNNEQMFGSLKEEVDVKWRISPRSAFQFVGTELIRNHMGELLPEVGDEFWVHHLRNRFINAQTKNPDIRMVVCDVRFQNEVDMIHSLGGIVIKVVRPDIESSDNHSSEIGIDDIDDWDHQLINSGTKDQLYSKIEQLFASFET